jgi:hypothetical protein
VAGDCGNLCPILFVLDGFVDGFVEAFVHLLEDKHLMVPRVALSVSVPGVALCVAPLVAQGADLDVLLGHGNRESDPRSHTRYWMYLTAAEHLKTNAGAAHLQTSNPAHYGGQSIQKFARRRSRHRTNRQLLDAVQDHYLAATGRILPVERYAHRPPR